jgi:2'-5' RNA ligase
MRCFVAIEPPEEVRAALVRAQDALRSADADVKWVERENLHLTLKFVGELADPAPLEAALRTLRHPPLRLRFEGLGLFPRVVWAGCSGGAESLAEAVERASGLPREDRPFTAHLTLGRVKSRRNERALRKAVEAFRATSFGAADVAKVALIRSTLTPRGPVYETLREFPLG